MAAIMKKSPQAARHFILMLIGCMIITIFAMPMPHTVNTLRIRDKAQNSGARLWVLSQGRSKLFTMGPNGERPKDIVTGLRTGIDGVAVDRAAGYVYISSMHPGTIQRARLDGSSLTTIVPSGIFRVGKQLIFVNENGANKLYWSDREGEKVMRSNADGSHVEVVVDTSRDKCTSTQCKHAVGVAVDARNGWVYWTQKGNGSGNGSIRRAPIQMPAGQTAATRNDIQVVLNHLPQPIDLKLVDGHGLYWTERSGPGGGNSVHRIALSSEVLAGKAQFPAKVQLVSGLREAIGITADTASGKIWFTDLSGAVYVANMDGSGKRVISSGNGALTGIDFA